MTDTLSNLYRVAMRLNSRARQAAKRKSTLGKASKQPLPALIYVIDPTRTPNPSAAINKIPKAYRGRAAVIYRHFGAPDKLHKARSLLTICRRRNFRLLIGADVNLAAKIRADGVHLPERLAHNAPQLKATNPKWLITAAAHSATALRRTKMADAVLVSPVFATNSSGAIGRKPLGQIGLAKMQRQATTPVYALGGINKTTAKRLANARAIHGIAVSTAFEDDKKEE